ncbi:hypothetical protein A5712_05630 [Mycobacterium sp. E2327]|uniref:PE family protein n=1 Tax=Mycobacterium sp. E2327 TaxID=1834132 RepID=UPI0007FE52EE|nr:PE family protein [Mycobacterium sp. E2327]OBI13214.1 hypothetical protein A5712_05630 [Mycobacterium sp. E2327]
MAYVIAAPEMMTAAATDWAALGSNVNAAHMVAAAPTTALVPAAADEVSAAITRAFSEHAARYQALAGQAAAFNDQFVQHLIASAGAYVAAEAANAVELQPIVGSFTSNATALLSQFLNSPIAFLTQLIINGLTPVAFLSFALFFLAWLILIILLVQYLPYVNNMIFSALAAWGL